MAFAYKEPFLPVTNRVNVLHSDLAVRPYPAADSDAMKHVKDFPWSNVYSQSEFCEWIFMQKKLE